MSQIPMYLSSKLDFFGWTNHGNGGQNLDKIVPNIRILSTILAVRNVVAL